MPPRKSPRARTTLVVDYSKSNLSTTSTQQCNCPECNYDSYEDCECDECVNYNFLQKLDSRNDLYKYYEWTPKHTTLFRFLQSVYPSLQNSCGLFDDDEDDYYTSVGLAVRQMENKFEQDPMIKFKIIGFELYLLLENPDLYYFLLRIEPTDVINFIKSPMSWVFNNPPTEVPVDASYFLYRVYDTSKDKFNFAVKGHYFEYFWQIQGKQTRDCIKEKPGSVYEFIPDFKLPTKFLERIV